MRENERIKERGERKTQKPETRRRSKETDREVAMDVWLPADRG